MYQINSIIYKGKGIVKVILATNNKNKIIEIRNKLIDLHHFEFFPLSSLKNPPEVIEDGDTFEKNALKKAMTISDYSGMAAMSDDSGLEVRALGGKPGVYSARYGGEGLDDAGRNSLILREMRGIEERRARFVCVIVLAFPDGTWKAAEGTCEGEITREPRGGMGFGYDPIFYIPALGKTMAELTIEEKNRHSHRAMALGKAAEILMGPGH